MILLASFLVELNMSMKNEYSHALYNAMFRVLF